MKFATWFFHCVCECSKLFLNMTGWMDLCFVSMMIARPDYSPTK
jgi:hypothetical protein